jgi:hypothetical protein
MWLKESGGKRGWMVYGDLMSELSFLPGAASVASGEVGANALERGNSRV